VPTVNDTLPTSERLAWGVRELARAASMSERFLWKAIADGRLVALRVAGRTLVADLEARKFLGLTQ
jgi:hypothetical protein